MEYNEWYFSIQTSKTIEDKIRVESGASKTQVRKILERKYQVDKSAIKKLYMAGEVK